MKKRSVEELEADYADRIKKLQRRRAIASSPRLGEIEDVRKALAELVATDSQPRNAHLAVALHEVALEVDAGVAAALKELGS